MKVYAISDEDSAAFNNCRYELRDTVDELIMTLRYAQECAQDMRNIGLDTGMDIKNIAKIGVVCLALNNAQDALKTLKEVIDNDEL